MDLALIGCAAACELTPDGVFSSIAVALGVAAPTPRRHFGKNRNMVFGRHGAHFLRQARRNLDIELLNTLPNCAQGRNLKQPSGDDRYAYPGIGYLIIITDS